MPVEENQTVARTTHAELAIDVSVAASAFLIEHLFWMYPDGAQMHLYEQLSAVIGSACEYVIGQVAAPHGAPPSPFEPSLN